MKRIVEGDDFSLLPPVAVRFINRLLGRRHQTDARTIGVGPEIMTILADTLDRTGRVINQLDEHDLARESTCPPWTIGELVAHIIAVTDKFTRFARGETRVEQQAPPVDASIGITYRAARAASNDAWSHVDPASVCTLSFGTFDCWTAAAINVFDVAVHGWDLRLESDQPYTIDEGTGKACLAVARLLVNDASRRAGHYRDAPADAKTSSAFEEALVLTGRRVSTAPPQTESIHHPGP